jgi:predicted MFS family arabinose efflux permease
MGRAKATALPAAAPATRGLAVQISAAVLVRLVINVSRRMVYTFAPAFSRGLGVPLTGITSLIALNQATGMLSPVFGPLGDRWGYRVMMLGGLAALGAGTLVAGFFPFYASLVLALFMVGLAKSLFDPALQAYVGERVSYQRRGLAMGLIELSWAGSSLIGIPVIGLLIDRLGWQSPFLVLGGLALLGLLGIWLFIPSDGRQRRALDRSTRLRHSWRLLTHERAALGALGFNFLVCAANDNVFVIYGAWLESNFGLTVVALGAATTVIGLAELTGEGLTALVSDRLGLRRAALGGLTLSALSYLLLPLLGSTLPLALLGLFLTFLTFEFTIVTSFSLFTEILPAARATMMASNLAAASAGRMAGALLGSGVWLTSGMAGNALVASAATGLGLVCLAWGLRGWRK